MSVNRNHILISLKTGSHLYGTSTEKSDIDIKKIYLPPLDDVLLGKRLTNKKELPTGHQAGDKMLPGETEVELIALQTFLNDYFAGQTYALEIGFGADHADIVQGAFDSSNSISFASRQSFEYVVKTNQMLYELNHKFTTKDVKKMVGYAIGQAQDYGLRTTRLQAINDAYDLICEDINNYSSSNLRLGHNPVLLEHLEKLPHVKRISLANAKGGEVNAPALDIAGKQFTFTTKQCTVAEALNRSLNEYGERAKQFAGQGADWKALSHAIRITEQVIELCETRQLTFPRSSAYKLLAVKQGKLSLEDAMSYLNDVFSKIDSAVKNSGLPERTPELEAEFEAWKLKTLKSFYGLK